MDPALAPAPWSGEQVGRWALASERLEPRWGAQRRRVVVASIGKLRCLNSRARGQILAGSAGMTGWLGGVRDLSGLAGYLKFDDSNKSGC